MDRHHSERKPGYRKGSVARGVFMALLGILPITSLTCFARPAQQLTHSAPAPARPGNQAHLGAWLARHQGLSPQEQEKALQNEPGFSHLPPETQQRLLGRLQQLNRMPPAQRQRMTDRIEAMEKLSPQMRQQVQSSFMQFRSMSPDRQLMMKKAFRDLREFPPEQRQAMMNSGRFQAQFSPQERNVLGNMLAVEPYRPAANGPGVGYAAPQYGH